MIQTRVEKHKIKQNDKYFSMLMGFCSKSKLLYNHANYIVRQEFIKNGKWIRYAALDTILKNDEEYPDYRNMPTAQSAQQILRLLDKNWKSFFASIKDWTKHKDKYLGRPKLPKYLKPSGKYILILTNQNCKLQNGTIHFPKSFNGFEIIPKFLERTNYKSFQQVRFLPHKDYILAELVYNIEIPDQKVQSDRCIGIDIGINNLATVCNNFGGFAFIINGKPLKSINQYYNKWVSHFRSVTKCINHRDYSNRMQCMTSKRNAIIDDYMHKASRRIIDFCIDNQVSTIVIGQNKEWKQNANIGKRNNQNFVQIPFSKFISMIQYKAEEVGIAVITTEESYTSGTSFIDNELPEKSNYNKSRRRARGMFVSNSGIKINADLNGAYQILKKVVPIKWDRGCVLHPVVVTV